MKKEEEIIKKRLLELSRTGYERDIYTFSDFLNLNELELFNTIKNNLYGDYEIFGGYSLAQRQMIKFIPGAVFYEVDFPYEIISIRPKNIKFKESLSHRDYLGSILGLGIERSKVGDIIIEEDEVLCFIHESMVNFIIKNLLQVKRTYIYVSRSDRKMINYEPAFELITGSIQSIRLDTILSLVINESRSKLVRHIECGNVFINSKQVFSNGFKLKVGDIISVRGVGKFEFTNIGGISKRGKQFVEIKRYI